MTPVLLLMVACGSEPSQEAGSLSRSLNDGPPEPARPDALPVVRSVEDLLAHDRQWVELHGVVGSVKRLGPPKPQWSVRVDVPGGAQIYPEHHGAVDTWAPLAGQPVAVVGLLSLCGSWGVSQAANLSYLTKPEQPIALAGEMPVATNDTERDAARQAIEAYCEQRGAALMQKGR